MAVDENKGLQTQYGCLHFVLLPFAFPSFLFHSFSQDVFWSDAGDQLAVISATDSFFILKYDAEAVANFAASGEEADEDGIEDAFEVRFLLTSFLCCT